MGRVVACLCGTGLERSDQFCVMEIGASGPGTLDDPISLVQPKIGVVTTVGFDHISQYGNIEAIAMLAGVLLALFINPGFWQTDRKSTRLNSSH